MQKANKPPAFDPPLDEQRYSPLADGFMTFAHQQTWLGVAELQTSLTRS
jgi:hypothetical protein